MSGTVWSVSSRDCLISLGDTSSGSPQVVAGVTVSSLYKAEQRAAVLTLSPPGDTWVASVLAAVSTDVHISL